MTVKASTLDWARRGLAMAVLALVMSTAVTGPAAAQDDRVFTIGNYPVDARAQDAVAAKEKAIAEGQQSAFRSLLKRIVPVTSYKALAQLRGQPAANLISGIAVRSERNSTTSYTATLDFTFDARRVRDLLRQRGIPFTDEQARETALVLVLQPVGQAAVSVLSPAAWREAWNALDLVNGLTPVRLHDRPAALTPELIKAALSNPEAHLRTTAVLAKSGQAVLAIAEPDLSQRKLFVTLSGVDGVGPFVLRRTWRMDPNDAAYAAELAAVVAMGVLEGRWKAVRARGVAAAPTAGAPLQPVQLIVEFRSFQEWQMLRRQLEETPGVSDFSIGGLSSSGANIALRYPGGGSALASALGPAGIAMQGSGITWVARGL